MKNKYVESEIEIIYLLPTDIVTTSDPEEPDPDNPFPDL